MTPTSVSDNVVQPEPSPGTIRPPGARSGWGPAVWRLVVCGTWLAACVFGSYVGMGYDFQPGALGVAPEGWPADAVLEPCPGRVTVLAFLHPRCVCTAATVHHLVEALRQYPDARLVAVMFAPPEPEAEDEWQNTAYEQTLRAKVGGTRIVPDPGGAEAARFGALTSGTILVYDRQGREVFRGGITGRRGGEGDNPGLRLFRRALAGEQPDETLHPPPVFGCSLQIPNGPAPRARGEAP